MDSENLDIMPGEHMPVNRDTTGSTKYYYAVANGKKTGVFKAAAVREFNEHLRELTNGYPDNKHKRFGSLLEALHFMKQHNHTMTGLFDKDFNKLDFFLLEDGHASFRIDINFNTDQNDNCGKCGIEVGSDDLHPQCDACDKWFHLACLTLTSNDIPETEWTCPECSSKVNEARLKIPVTANQPDDPVGEKDVLLLDASDKTDAELDAPQQMEQSDDFYISEIRRLTKENENKDSVIKTLNEEKECLIRKLEKYEKVEATDEPRLDVIRPQTDKHIEDTLAEILSRLELVEAFNKNFKGQLKTAVNASALALEKAEGLSSKPNELNNDVIVLSNDGAASDFKRTSQGGSSGTQGEGSTVVERGASYAEALTKGPRKRANRKKGRGVKGFNGRESRFELLADSHGRGLSKLLPGAEVHFKPGARMERVVEGAGGEGTSCTVVMGGTNDVSVDGVKRGLQKLRERVGKNRRVVIVGVPHRYDYIYPNIENQIAMKNELIKHFCDFLWV